MYFIKLFFVFETVSIINIKITFSIQMKLAENITYRILLLLCFYRVSKNYWNALIVIVMLDNVNQYF